MACRLAGVPEEARRRATTRWPIPLTLPFLCADNRVHPVVTPYYGNIPEASSFEVFGQFGKSERAACFCRHQHVDREERSGHRQSPRFLHQDISYQDLASILQRCANGREQTPVFLVRVLMDNRTDPRQISPGRKRVHEEVAPNEPHPMTQPRFCDSLLGKRDYVLQIEKGGHRIGLGAEKRNRPRTGCSTDIQ